MADTSQQELSEPHTNGVVDGLTEEEKSKMRPADIDADMREMERRKRVELIMNSKMFKEELERIIETQLKDGSGPSGLLQQISDMMGAQGARFNSNVFKNSNCVVPINDIRGVEAKGYERGEKVLRCKLAAVFRLLDLYGWTQGVGGQITARLNQDQEHFLVNPYGLLYHEVTASSLVKVDMQGQVVEQGTTNFGVHVAGFQLHSTIHAARPDIKCIIHITTPTVTAVSSLKGGLLPLGQESVVIGEVSTHQYIGETVEPEEREKITRNLGPINKVMLLTNRGALCCGETVEEAFYNVYNTVLACETQLKLMPVGLDNLNLLTEEARKAIFEASRKPPVPFSSAIIEPSPLAEKLEKRWRIGGTEFEALMRMLDNAGFRTGYIYRHPLIKSEPPRPRNDVEVPPAVSSLGYLLEEEELYKQGLWKGGRKGADRSRWLNSPNVYQKVEILETGTPDPKKITKWVDQNAEEWVSDGSPTHSSTPVRIDSALQFVPKNTNPKEFKQLQQQIKDYRRSEKISAGPQSHILEGVSWEEAKKMQDATISGTGEQVVLVGAASKGIIQRGFQHNAMVYKTPYAKNPFDAVTDQELDQYKKEVERKTKGDLYDESQSESEALSSFNISRATHESSTAKSPIQSPISVTSETEEESRDEPRVLRIEKKHVPVPSQAEVVLSDVDATTEFLNEMRRNAIDSRNNRKQDESGDDSSEFKMQEYAWWRVKTYEETRLEVAKTGTTAVPMTPIRLNIPFKKYQINNRNEFSSKLPLSPRMLKRQYFFDQYDKIYNAYRNGSHDSLNLILKMPIRKYSNIFIKEPNNNNNNIDNRFASNNGTVKHLIAKYSFIDTKECKQSLKNRKRNHVSSTLSPNYPKLSLSKIPRLALSHARKLEDLESPRLVEAAMNNKNLHKNNRQKNILDNEYFLTQKTIKIENKILPIEETTEIINTEDINGNVNDNRETTESFDKTIKVEAHDKNGNSVTPLDDTQVNQELIDTKVIETTGSPEKDQSSAEDIISQQTVVERGAIEKELASGKDFIEVVPPIEDDEKWLNELADEMEDSFYREINENQPWRYSSPISKHYQREDSMTEVINSINVNLTPTKSLSTYNFHLPDTGVSIKYNLNSTSMSTIYRLTPTGIDDDDDDTNKEHITCGKECPQCLILDDPVELENLSPDDVRDELSPFKWDEPFVNRLNKNPKGVIDLNKTIDLFDNSIEMDTDSHEETEESVCIKDEPCSLEESDLLELPHSTVAELKESDEATFHEDITTSVNEIIAGLGEREALLKAADIVDDVISVACSNLEEESSQACNVEIKQENQEEKEEICEIIHKITQQPVEKFNNSNDEGKRKKFIVVDELIHHVIDKNSSQESNSTSESSTTESFNIKKVKESVNTELKEMQSNLSDNRNIETSVEGDLNDQEMSDVDGGDTEKLINDIKQIIDDIDSNTPNEAVIRDEFLSIVDYLDDQQLCSDQSDVYQNQLKLIIKQSIENSNDESNANLQYSFDSLNSNHSPENMILANYSEAVQQFKEQCERILNNQSDKSEDSSDTILNSNDQNPSHTEMSEFSPTEVNVSLDKEAIEEHELTDTISMTDNDTKSDNSKEKVKLSMRRINFCLIEYEGKQDKSKKSEEDSEDTISDVVEKDITQMWDNNEAEIERSCNEIRSNDVDGSFIEYEAVDDVISNNNIKMACDSLTSNEHISLFSKINTETKPTLSAITEEAECIEEENEKEEIIDRNKFMLPAIEEADEITEKEDNIFIPPNLEDTMPVEDTEDEENEQEADDIAKEVEKTELVHTETVIEGDKCEESSNKPQEDEHCRDVQMSEYFNDELNEPIQQSSSTEQENLSNESSMIFEETESQAIASLLQILIEEETPKIIENVDDSVLIIEPDLLEVKTIEVVDIDSDKDESIAMSSMTTNFYSCHDTSVSMQANQSNEMNCISAEEDDLESKYSTGVNSEDTYTLSDYNSETERDITYSADISSNLRKSDSFSTCDLNPCDTTVNMGDVSSAYESVDKPKNSEEPELKKCSVCTKYFKAYKEIYDRSSMNYEVQKKIEYNELSYASLDGNPSDEVCSTCIMTYSMETRDFIRLERNVIGEELHYEKLKVSPLKTPPKYEDTTLCQIVAKISLTDSLSSSNNNSLNSVVNVEK
ncbi:uncharacterized protein hts isoform X3 [Chelonus insularis]|uniref:uncharacterized protein hts isoform X3 n=1 Tax=Chelonus insularis TaxID=460826 RepID=UPI00158EF544|nr:uncharacterized protein LOC118067726 isoform X3 [Chelonus insularis]